MLAWMNPERSGDRLRLAAAAGVWLLLSSPPAWAQYNYTPNHADEQGRDVRYFGSAKDSGGAIVPGASIVLQRAYVFITDHQGRFAGRIPPDIAPETMSISCSKPGYEFVRISKRIGSTKKKRWIQVDCILRPAS